MDYIDAARLNSLKVVQVSDDTFALDCNDKLYYIGAVLFRIIQHLQAGKTFPEIQELIAAEYRLVLSREKFDQIVGDTLEKVLATADASDTAKQSYVYGQVTLIREHTLAKLTKNLEFLFRRVVAVPLLALSLLTTGLFLWALYRTHLLDTTISAGNSLAVMLGSYLFFALVGLFHELGHATAAARYKITPKEVGFGFYLVLPVLYTDISKVWILDKYKRVQVNLAGIYFQLLVNLLLYLAYTMSLRWNGPHGAATYLIISFFLANATLALYSLNPFFRNDGYWVCSDYFAVPNLAAAAQDYPRKCWNYVRSKGQMPFRGPGLTLGSELLLLAYSVGRLCLVSWLSYLGYSGFYHSFQETMQRLHHEGQFANETPWEYGFYLLKLGLFCVLFLVLAYRTIKPAAVRLLARLGWLAPTAEPTAVAVSS
ncbi:hypothetical protein [Hymenobacter cavernae]|uniref:Peptide zinc metalloprotease protein n=1 Tax=Hymenobacter cavernae TaxID=2044852 RepID=A0ABQ1TVY5_9BACT|nr:hypothetical protein [Hymenobacter cavernae]GGF03813.1 hypothetical protein GCM10011383_13590 [Hymenobacter cavernae]